MKNKSPRALFNINTTIKPNPSPKPTMLAVGALRTRLRREQCNIEWRGRGMNTIRNGHNGCGLLFCTYRSPWATCCIAWSRGKPTDTHWKWCAPLAWTPCTQTWTKRDMRQAQMLEPHAALRDTRRATCRHRSVAADAFIEHTHILRKTMKTMKHQMNNYWKRIEKHENHHIVKKIEIIDLYSFQCGFLLCFSIRFQ